MGETLLSRAGILTLDQLAQALEVNPDTIARWEREDNFPFRAAGRTKLYDIDAIKRWISEGGKT